MKVRKLRKLKPYPKPYRIGASVRVPPYEGFFGMPMDTVRLSILGTCQSLNPSHSACMRRIDKARTEYLTAHGQNKPATAGQGMEGGDHV